MRNKILFVALMVATLVCIFAMTVSAAEIPEWTEITVVDGMKDKGTFGADGTGGATSRVLMSDGITYPAYYICKDSGSLGISFTDLNAKTGKEYAAENVVRIEIPKGTVTVSDALKLVNGYSALLTVVIPEGVTTISQYGFKTPDVKQNPFSPIISITLPSTLTTIGPQAFYGCNSLKELIIPEGVSAIPKEMAYYATSLDTVVFPSTIVSIGEGAFRSAGLANGVVIPEGCTTIGKYAFKGSGTPSVTVPSTLTNMDVDIFRGCPELTDVTCKSTVIYDYMFADCPALKNITLENTVEIKQRAFNVPSPDTLKIETLVLPDTVTTIGDYAFPRNTLKELVLPASLTQIGTNTFYDSKALERVVVLGTTIGKNMFSGCGALEELVLTEDFVTFGSGCINNVSQTSFITYYTGTDYERIKTLCSASTRFSQAKYYSYEDYENENYTHNKFMVIYDTNLCVAAFNGVHTEGQDDGDCTTALICTMCKEHTFKEAREHVSSQRVTYTSFLEQGEYYVGCTNEGCTHGTTQKLNALFECLGYSASENGTGGIAIGFAINKEAITVYKNATGNALKYGVFVVSKDRLGENDIFGTDGKAASGVVSAEIKSDHSYFDLKVVGFKDENKNKPLAMGAYVAVADENGTKYSYLQDDTNSEHSGKYYFASYSDIVGTPKAEQ